MKALKFVFPLLILGLLQCSKNNDDDTGNNSVRISISDLSVDEGQNYTNIAVQLKLDAASDQQITANISTSDGTAEANRDYRPVDNEAVVFAARETEKTYEISIAGDFILEEDEFFEVMIVSVVGPATIDNATARIDILNDDVMGVQEVPVSLTIDWPALANLSPGSEVAYEIMNFGQPDNVSNADFTSVATVNDTIIFGPKFSLAGDTILFYELTFEPGIDPEDYFEDLSDWSDTVGVSAKLVVIDDTVNDLEFKYDLWFYIGKVSGGRVGPYFIDPKIRIPRQ